jgi:hypothetical protein
VNAASSVEKKISRTAPNAKKQYGMIKAEIS